MSGGWDPWGPPREDEEPRAELPPAPPDPDEGSYGWGDYPEWPAAGPSSSEYWDYGYRPAESAPTVPDRRSHDPLGRLFPGLSRGTRVFLDWVLTIVGAILIVLALKHWVVNPYRIPSSSMEPYLNCAKPGAGLSRRLERPRARLPDLPHLFESVPGRCRRLQHAEGSRERLRRGRDVRQARHRSARRDRERDATRASSGSAAPTR